MLTKEAKKLKAEYMASWRQSNRNKAKEANDRYWNKKAQIKLELEEII